MTCIYCLESKGAHQFNREHVIPQAFGTFEHNLVLTCVCKGCNKYFGDTIDLKLARDSPEGWDRVVKGHKNPSAFKGLGKRSTTHIRVLSGPRDGVLCEGTPAPLGSDIEARTLAQVGFSSSGQGPFRYFLLEQLPSPYELFQQGYTWPLFFRIYGIKPELAETALRARGFPPLGDVQKLAQPPKSGQGYVQFMISHDEFRAIAKIALNYVAAVAGPAIARMPQFNEVRRYVREDVRPAYHVVGIGEPKPITREGKAVNGHLLAFTRRGQELDGLVSLFGRLRYLVRLSLVPFAVEVAWGSAHIFDVDARRIYPVEPGTRI